jgi:hypothetical protein
MNIKIKHFQKKNPYSNSGKNKLLAALGLAASLGIAGCETTSTSGDPVMPESSSSTGLIEMPESSSSTEVPESSSSIKTPIPIGGVPVDPIQPLAGTIMVIDEESSSSISSSSSTEVIESSSSIDIPVVGIPAMPEPELVPEEFDPDKIIPIVIEEP